MAGEDVEIYAKAKVKYFEEMRIDALHMEIQEAKRVLKSIALK